MGISQIFFLILLILSFYYAKKQFGFIFRNIQLGKERQDEVNGAVGLKNMLLVAFGQKKMFKRIVPAVMHGFIYVAFLFTQVEFIEILIDGLFGVHRFFAPYLGSLYTLILGSIEILSLLAFIGTVVFLWRRNILRLPRFWKPEMAGWPTLDANIILFLEILLIVGIFTMNGADVVLQERDPAHYPDTGFLPISSIMGPLVLGGLPDGILQLMERSGWWLHFMVVLGFLFYIPRSKHLHIFFAFPNTYLAPQTPRGEMENMPDIMNEVKSMMGLEVEGALDEGDGDFNFGANDITGLTKKTLLDAYTCTECGRCTSVCPANITGKKLSPRKVMMDIRDRAEDIGRNLDSKSETFIADDERRNGVKELSINNYDDGKTLFDYISREEIHACTSCNACVEACPVMINPLTPILEMRRYEILTESAGPSDWLPMFNSVENSGSVWQLTVERDQWAKDFNEENS